METELNAQMKFYTVVAVFGTGWIESMVHTNIVSIQNMIPSKNENLVFDIQIYNSRVVIFADGHSPACGPTSKIKEH